MMNLAIVLLSDPKIVMIEEPTTELDSSAIKVFGKLLKNLKTSEKKTIIFTTQNVRDTELADSVAILEKERNFTGTLTEVKRKILKGLYILIISIRDEESSREKIKKTVQEIVEKHIPRLTSLDSTTDSVLKYKVSSSDNKIELSQLFTELGLLPQIQISFKRLSLGEYLEKEQELNSSEPQKKKRIVAIEQFCLLTQAQAIFLMRLFSWKPTKKFIIPYISVIVIVFEVFHILKDDPDEALRTNISAYLPFLWINVSNTIVGFSTINFVQQRESYQNHVLKIAGLNSRAHWLGNFLADLIIQIPLIIGCLISHHFINPLILWKQHIYWIFIFINMIILSYRLSLSRWINSRNFFLMSLLSIFASSTAGLIVLEATHFGLTGYILLLIIDIATTLFVSHLPIQYFMGSIEQIALINPIDFAPESDIYRLVVMILSLGITFFFLINKDPAPSKMARNRETQKKIDLYKAANSGLKGETQTNPAFLKFCSVSKKEDAILDSIVSEVNFELSKGSILGLIGPNRCGRSEILDIYARETFVCSGKILLQDQELPCPSQSLVKIGVCLPTDVFWKDLSLRRHLEIYGRIRGIPSSQIKQAAQDLIDELDLIKYTEIDIRKIEDESVKRKLSVALAVIGAPDLILLDEPTKGLDPVGRKQVWKILKELTRKENKESAILIATNQIEDAELKADRIGIMMNGELKKIDLMDKIKREADYYLKIEGIEWQENNTKFNQMKENIPRHGQHFVFVSGRPQEGKLIFRVSQQNAKESFSAVFPYLADDVDKEDIQGFSFSEKLISEEYEDLTQKMEQQKIMNQNGLDFWNV